MSNQGKISFLLGEGKLDDQNAQAHIVKEVANIQSENDNKRIKETIASQKTKKADHHDMISRGTKIKSTTGGVVTDIGGPKKFLKSETSNSIFDTEVIDRLMKVKTSQEESKEIKENINKVRNSINSEVMDELANSLKNTDQRKASSIASLSEYSGSTYRKPSNGLSIFDEEFDFGRVPDKTEGEKVSERVSKEKDKKDNSWQKVSKAKTIKDLENRLIDSFLNKENEK